MAKNQFNKLVNSGIVSPNGSDWRVSIKFVDGTSRTVRISPGRLSEEQAIERAKLHCRIFEENVLDKIEATRVERSTQVVANATITKTATPKEEETNDPASSDDQ